MNIQSSYAGQSKVDVDADPTRLNYDSTAISSTTSKSISSSSSSDYTPNSSSSSSSSNAGSNAVHSLEEKQNRLTETPRTKNNKIEIEIELLAGKMVPVTNRQRTVSYNVVPKYVYCKKKRLGRGSFGSVYAGKCLIDGKRVAKVAIKTIKWDKKDGEDFQVWWQKLSEITILPQLKHPNIIQLHTVNANEETKKVYLVMDYVTTNLRDYLDVLRMQECTLLAKSRQRLMQQLLKAVDYLHLLGVLHRDLKPGNLLIDPNSSQLIVADFGSSRLTLTPVERTQLADAVRITEPPAQPPTIQPPAQPPTIQPPARAAASAAVYTLEVCTRWYRAPELLLGDTHYTPAIDIWSVGCIFAELFTNSVLFRGSKTDQDQLYKIFRILGTPNFSTWRDFSRLPLYSDRFPKYPRIGLKQTIPILETDPLAYDLLFRMLQYDPKNRITAVDALKHSYFSCAS